MSESTTNPSEQRESLNVRKGPAFIVVAIALFIIVAGGLIAAFSGNGRPRAVQPRVVRLTNNGVKSSMQIVSAVSALAAIEDNGSIPRDIEDALFVPSGASVTGSENFDGNAGQFDRQITLTAPYGAKLLVDCYRLELPRLGWKLSATQPNATANGESGTEVLAQHIASDGYYWEVGVIIGNSAQSVSPALGGSSASTTSSTVHIELLEVPDGS